LPEKIKITKAEIAELYDITDDEVKEVVQDDGKNATFEEYTEIYDKKQVKEIRDES